MKATASCTSKGTVTLPSLVPLSYSFGTRSTKRSSWLARLTCSSGVSGAAVKPSRSASTCSRAASKAALSESAPAAASRSKSSVRSRAGRRRHAARRTPGRSPASSRARSRWFRRSGRRNRVRPPAPLRRGWSGAAPGRYRAGPFRSAGPASCGADLARRQFLQGGGAVDPRAGEAGGLAEVADLHPGPRPGDFPPAGGLDRDRHRAAAQGGNRFAARCCQRRLRRVRRRLAWRQPAQLSISRSSWPVRPLRGRARRAPPRRASARSTAPSSPSSKQQLRLCFEQLGANRVRRLPGRLACGRSQAARRRERPPSRSNAATAALTRAWQCGRAVVWIAPSSAFLQFDFELFRRLRHLAGDRLGLRLSLGAERVGLLGGEFLAVGLAVAQVGGEVDEASPAPSSSAVACCGFSPAIIGSIPS